MAAESSKQPGKDPKARLNLLIEEELKQWAKAYAKEKNTSVTALVVSHFILLRELEKRGLSAYEALGSFKEFIECMESDCGVPQI